MQPNHANAHSVAAALSHREYLKEQLLVQFPDLKEDEQALVDTLDGISDLDELLIALTRSADEDKMLIDGIKIRVEELAERRKRLERRVETKHGVVLRTMERAGKKKLEAPEFTISTRATPASVVITDEKIIPEQFWRAQAPTLDKKAIGDALKASQQVPGAQLSNGGSALAIRRK